MRPLWTDISKVDGFWLHGLKVYDVFQTEIIVPVYGHQLSEFGGARSETVVWPCILCFIAARAEIATNIAADSQQKLILYLVTITQQRNYFQFDQSLSRNTRLSF